MKARKPSTETGAFLIQLKTLWEGEGLDLKYLGDAVARSMRGDRTISLKRAAEIAEVLWKAHADARNEKGLQPKIQRFWAKLGQALNQGASLPTATGFETFKKLFLERLGFLPPPAGDDAFDPQQATQSHDFVTWAGSSGSVNLAIVFTDIVGAVAHASQLGEAGWEPIHTAHFQQAGKLLQQHGGYLANTTGDGVLVVFRDSVAALRFAREFESAPGHDLLRIRVGIHTGPMRVKENNAFGQSVNLAARICAEAKQGGIWVSNRVHEDWLLNDPMDRLPWTRHNDAELKGFPNLFLLWSLPPSKEPPPPPLPPDLKPYLEHLIKHCRFVPLRGVHKDDRAKQGDPQHTGDDPDYRVELERIFVELDTTRLVEVEEAADPSEKALRVETVLADSREGQHKKPVPVLKVVASDSSRHVVLHGAPGCGKSTFIRFLVLALAHCGLGEHKQWLPRLPGWPPGEASLLPIRIELRHFAAWLDRQKITEPEPCHLWNHFNQVLAELQSKNSWLDLRPTVEQIARSGRIIFLLDGLDEVPSGKGKLFVRDCLEKFAGEPIGKACRILVTCRTRSYEADYGKGKRLHLFETTPAAADGKEPATAFELAPFDDPKKEYFVKAWYQALVALKQVEAEQADQRIKVLQAAVCARRHDSSDQNKKLADLASNPLLLTVIAHLHSSQKDLKLPDNRAELFDDLIDLLLTRWAERHGRKSEAEAETAGAGETLGELLLDPGVRYFEREHLLQLVAELAHDHYRGGQARALILIPAATLRRRLEEQYHDPEPDRGSALGAAWAARVMNFIQFRAGLLNSPDGGENYDFPHSLLGEFLVALHLARQRQSCEVTAAKVTADGNWDEVVRLVAGHHIFVDKQTNRALDLVEELCRPVLAKTLEPVADLEWRRVALAADILHEMGPERLVRERHQGPACRQLVRRLSELLIQQGALPVRDRARVGMILGRLGDQRPGVGIIVTAPKRPCFVWCGGQGEVSQRDASVWQQAFPAQKVFKIGEPKERKGQAWGSFVQFDCTRIAKPFFIGKYPITVAQYQVFVDAKGYERKDEFWTEAGQKWLEGRLDDQELPDWYRAEYRQEAFPIARPKDYAAVYQTPNHPRVGVSWREARAFCAWLNSSEIRPHLAGDLGLRNDRGLEIRLPTEAEWELAARWNLREVRADDRPYPWGGEGQEADLTERCNWYKTGIGSTSAVGLFPKGQADCGAADLSGNVWEWCQTKWIDGDDNEALKRYNSGVYEEDDGHESRVVRGGSWGGGSPVSLSCACRYSYPPDARGGSVGFRCVVVGESAR